MQKKQSSAWCWATEITGSSSTAEAPRSQESQLQPPVLSLLGDVDGEPRCRTPADMSPLWDGSETLPGPCEAEACQA